MRRSAWLFSTTMMTMGGLVASCGSPRAPSSPSSSTSASESAAPAHAESSEAGGGAAPSSPAKAAGPAGVPSSCAAPGAAPCVPDAAFVKRLCDGSFPDVALALMAKTTPFTRMYMKADVEGWNADGGASARARLRFDEEILVLRRRAPPANGVVVGSGGAGYLVMRWDGNCYTLEEGELTAKKPPAPGHAPIPWRFYAERTKNALLESAKILAAYQKRGKECKGMVSGEVSRACEQADAALSSAVVSEIREGMFVPAPERLP